MDTVRIGAEVLLCKLGDEGRAISLMRAISALRYVLPVEGDTVDFNQLIKTITNTGDDAAFAVSSWLGKGTNQSITPSHVLAAFGTRAVSLYAKELGVGVTLAIESLAKALPEFIDSNRANIVTDPALDLMTFKKVF